MKAWVISCHERGERRERVLQNDRPEVERPQVLLRHEQLQDVDQHVGQQQGLGDRGQSGEHP
jgi:hypothetical protein